MWVKFKSQYQSNRQMSNLNEMTSILPFQGVKFPKKCSIADMSYLLLSSTLFFQLPATKKVDLQADLEAFLKKMQAMDLQLGLTIYGMADKVTTMLWTNMSKSRLQNFRRHYRVYSTNTRDIPYSASFWPGSRLWLCN